MRMLRIATVALLVCLPGCQAIDSQLQRGPNGEPSRLEQEIRAAAPVMGPYGALAVALASITAGVYGAFKGHGAAAAIEAHAPCQKPEKPTA
jgi:hypothetical protein